MALVAATAGTLAWALAVTPTLAPVLSAPAEAAKPAAKKKKKKAGAKKAGAKKAGAKKAGAKKGPGKKPAAKKPGAKMPAAKGKGGKDPALTAAKRLFSEGNVFFDSGQFDKALAAYTMAYETKPLPGLLINIAQCHRNLRNYERSLFFYRKYLIEEPETPRRAAIEAVIEEMVILAAEAERREAERIAAEKAAAEAAAEAERRKAISLEAMKAAEAAEAARLEAEAAKARRPAYAKAWVLAHHRRRAGRRRRRHGGRHHLLRPASGHEPGRHRLHHLFRAVARDSNDPGGQ